MPPDVDRSCRPALHRCPKWDTCGLNHPMNGCPRHPGRLSNTLNRQPFGGQRGHQVIACLAPQVPAMNMQRQDVINDLVRRQLPHDARKVPDAELAGSPQPMPPIHQDPVLGELDRHLNSTSLNVVPEADVLGLTQWWQQRRIPALPQLHSPHGDDHRTTKQGDAPNPWSGRQPGHMTSVALPTILVVAEIQSVQVLGVGVRPNADRPCWATRAALRPDPRQRSPKLLIFTGRQPRDALGINTSAKTPQTCFLVPSRAYQSSKTSNSMARARPFGAASLAGALTGPGFSGCWLQHPHAVTSGR